jgi:hypothetical protein
MRAMPNRMRAWGFMEAPNCVSPREKGGTTRNEKALRFRLALSPLFRTRRGANWIRALPSPHCFYSRTGVAEFAGCYFFSSKRNALRIKVKKASNAKTQPLSMNGS